MILSWSWSAVDQSERELGLASFPGLPTVQFLITCSMQNGGGRPGIFYHVNDVSVFLGRLRGGGVAHAFFISNLERYVFRFVNVRNSSTWGRNYKIRPQARSFNGLPPPFLHTAND